MDLGKKVRGRYFADLPYTWLGMCTGTPGCAEKRHQPDNRHDPTSRASRVRENDSRSLDNPHPM